ncbi:GNAT family N-acetyltransferase [Apibacter sp. HY039]|uniref:GNAT family N-acetyltransferase n=1 Tax=Apibacter sp. HY039 TaxID=2501476 RepID=UPI000FEBDCA9|nr:GNAT family N-acetyltransferase [Apibacter sp. HY039]
MKKAISENYTKINYILTKAFVNNKSVNYVLKQKKEKYISRLMDYSLYQGEKFGDIFLNEEETACAILIDHKIKKTTSGTFIQDIKFACCISGLKNAHKVIKKERITHETLPKNMNFIQLWFLGVDVLQQGKGKGSGFLQEIIEYYKGKKEAIVLETSTMQNITFYEKNGFKIYGVNKDDFGFDFYFFIYKY